MIPFAFQKWFTDLTGHGSPRAWQRHLADERSCRSRLIRIPTGMGKTEGVLAAWSYYRICLEDPSWPRRLVWCLPMRVLVEQTTEVARELARQIASRFPEAQSLEVHIAMGGENPNKDLKEWFLYPERPAIIIGTQDMLLSRALNRGYASGRARWPVEFGLLNHDALWVMDEVQLMDVGLATSAQLQAFREEDRCKGLRPCHSWWMSATLQPEWLRSVDTFGHYDAWIREPCVVTSSQRTGGLWEIPKTLVVDSIGPDDDEAFAGRILEEHTALPDGDYGRITLVVCNTVDRACRTFDALRAAGRAEGIELVHSRFRPAEREDWRERFLSRAACARSVDRIIVATQVVEAGVDISAGCLITELSPWPSLVQRFGRCARYGGIGKVIVIDRGRDETTALPYRPEELESAWDALQTLQDVGIASLESHEESLCPEVRSNLFPFTPANLLMRREFDELFDTTPDLTGADLDISRFIRSGDERDLQVFWLDLAKSESPPSKRRPQRRELCAVPFLKARDWLCGAETKTNRKPKLRKGMRAWVWDWIDGEWKNAERASLVPGRIVCVAAACGGYRTDRGFNPLSGPVDPAILFPKDPPEKLNASEEANNQNDSDAQSYTEWKTIACHCTEVAIEARGIAKELSLSAELLDILALAGGWHDWGKAHPAFQNMLLRKRENANDLRRRMWAKSNDPKFARPKYYADLDEKDERPGFRHELASSLGLFAILQAYAPQHSALLGPWSEAFATIGHQQTSHEPVSPVTPLIQEILNCSAENFDLLTYLIASHHGKVRGALHAAPKDQDYRVPPGDTRGLPIRGVREGDRLPSFVLLPDTDNVPEVALTLAPAMIGLSTRTGLSWRERCLGLLQRFGPSGLAFLEAVFRAADVRASQSTEPDPSLAPEESQ